MLLRSAAKFVYQSREKREGGPGKKLDSVSFLFFSNFFAIGTAIIIRSELFIGIVLQIITSIRSLFLYITDYRAIKRHSFEIKNLEQRLIGCFHLCFSFFFFFFLDPFKRFYICLFLARCYCAFYRGLLI